MDLAILYGPEVSVEAILEAIEIENQQDLPIRFTAGGPYIIKNKGLNSGKAIFMIKAKGELKCDSDVHAPQ